MPVYFDYKTKSFRCFNEVVSLSSMGKRAILMHSLSERALDSDAAGKLYIELMKG